MRGVRVPAGEHVVEFVYRPYLVPFILSLLALLGMAGWAVAKGVRA
jgi:hypothetical protein